MRGLRYSSENSSMP